MRLRGDHGCAEVADQLRVRVQPLAGLDVTVDGVPAVLEATMVARPTGTQSDEAQSALPMTATVVASQSGARIDELVRQMESGDGSLRRKTP